jgi:glycosyltransferase involved in cell wall biosynthesis
MPQNYFFYSVVIPVYNSAAIVDKTVNRVYKFLFTQGFRFEIILVNDGSGDESWNVIAALARVFPEVTAINLLKNYGQHNANLCGFRETKGDFIITLDDDLQNPPEEMGKLIEAAQRGHDIVIGQFKSKKHSLIRRLGSRSVGWLNRTVFDVKDNLVLSNFRIIRRDVIDRVCRDNSVSPYIPGLLLKYSTNRCNVVVNHLPRSEGKSNYTLRKLLRLVASILFNHSTIPLRFAAAFGFIVSGISFLLGLFYLIRTLIEGSNVPGWATLVVMMSFFNGVLILMLSVIGEYLIRVLREVGTHCSYEISEVIRH